MCIYIIISNHLPLTTDTALKDMSAAKPRFARGESRISFDMLKSLRRIYISCLLSITTNPKPLKPKTLNSELKP